MSISKMFILVFVGVLHIKCNVFEKKFHQVYEYVPLKEYKYSEANIQPGAEVQLIAFSGGKPDDKENVYYYQFIVINLSTGDTLRILTPLISIDPSAGVETKTYTTPLQFDPAKGITNAFYEVQDSSQNLFLQTDKMLNGDKVDTSFDVQLLMDHINENQLVVVNKSLSMFENPTYKTAVGILNFKKIPW